MAIQLDVQSIHTDVGDTKRFTLTPARAGGEPAEDPASITLTVTEYRSDAVTYETSDMGRDGKSYWVDHTFTASGTCRVEAVMTDAEGRSETTRGVISVR